MRWSWRVARIAGIEIRIHATFLLLLAWVAFDASRDGATAAAAGMAVVFMLAVFASVVLHEFGHALTARRYGIETRAITLLPIGGVAQLERIPRVPRQELLVALAGPAVSLALATALFVVLRVVGAPTSLAAADAAGASGFFAALMWTNLWLVGFNLLPGFPMDGGRVLRAIAATRLPYARATVLAARVGRVVAVGFAVVGIWKSAPLLLLIAGFVWFAGAGEAAVAVRHAAVDGVRVAHAMITDVRTLDPEDMLGDVAARAQAGFQRDFPVVTQAVLVGVLTRDALARGLQRLGPLAPVAAAMDRGFRTADAWEPLAAALDRMSATQARSIPVIADGRLVGMLVRELAADGVLLDAAVRATGG